MDEPTEDDPALLIRSGLDDRVWIPRIPGAAIADSECMAAASLRKVKAYVESQLPGEGGYWTKVDDDTWSYLGHGWRESR